MLLSIAGYKGNVEVPCRIDSGLVVLLSSLMIMKHAGNFFLLLSHPVTVQ
jgi:hypothetical protein